MARSSRPRTFPGASCALGRTCRHPARRDPSPRLAQSSPDHLAQPLAPHPNYTSPTSATRFLSSTHGLRRCRPPVASRPLHKLARSHRSRRVVIVCATLRCEGGRRQRQSRLSRRRALAVAAMHSLISRLPVFHHHLLPHGLFITLSCCPSPSPPKGGQRSFKLLSEITRPLSLPSWRCSPACLTRSNARARAGGPHIVWARAALAGARRPYPWTASSGGGVRRG